MTEQFETADSVAQKAAKRYADAGTREGDESGGRYPWVPNTFTATSAVMA